jgi:arylsulfatase A-like enzyme
MHACRSRVTIFWRWCGVFAAIASLSAVALRPPAGVARVVIVSVDGLRPDLLLRGRTPAIANLMQHGSYTLSARTIVEGYTVPSHVSMLTGVVPSRHGVTWNRHIEQAYPQVPTLFELARRAGYTTALAVGKTKLIVLTRPGTLDRTYIGNEDETDALDVARAATGFLHAVPAPGLLFVHFGDVDDAGHATGWGSPEQLEALEKVDRAFEMIRQELRDRNLIERTVIILTADHGGVGNEHPPEDVRSQLIPWIVSGPSVREGFDLTLVEGLSVDTMATFATACALLGIDVPGTIDGKNVPDILSAATQPR